MYWSLGIGRGEVAYDDLPVQFSAGTIVAVAGYFSTDDQYQHVIIATTNGKLREIYWKSGGAGAGQDDLPVQFSAGTIVAVAGYFRTDDQYQHVIVATTNGKLREIYWKSGGAGAGQDDLPVQFSAGTIVAVAGYFRTDDLRNHVIVGTSDGKVHDIWWKSGQLGIEGEYVLTEFGAGTIVAVAAYHAENEKRHHVIVGVKDGNMYDFSLISHL